MCPGGAEMKANGRRNQERVDKRRKTRKFDPGGTPIVGSWFQAMLAASSAANPPNSPRVFLSLFLKILVFILHRSVQVSICHTFDSQPRYTSFPYCSNGLGCEAEDELYSGRVGGSIGQIGEADMGRYEVLEEEAIRNMKEGGEQVERGEDDR
ncbi:hypothetical protein E3N88_13653 [Mikania micrantha]|uniref:Uncharacterized protein n=1 Tax=Mikania micrantha TaxID=192012 RepID=A0A5N6P193_9ASTR|nr:hypothetical protein E3N88_13653 [Mikania micrantha]